MHDCFRCFFSISSLPKTSLGGPPAFLLFLTKLGRSTSPHLLLRRNFLGSGKILRDSWKAMTETAIPNCRKMVNLSIDFALAISPDNIAIGYYGITNHIISEIEKTATLRLKRFIQWRLKANASLRCHAALGNRLQVLERRYKTIFSQSCISLFRI